MFDDFINRRKEELEVYMQRDPAARGALEIIFCYPGLHAIWWHRLSHKLWQWKLYLLARFSSHLARVATGIEIHPAVIMGERVFIDHGMGIVLGASAEIGDDCSIYQGVTLGGTTQTFKGKRHPTLEARVIVGAGAKILGPILIGAGARIGSNAVVLNEVPKGATAVGIPAQILESKDKAKDEEEPFVAYAVDDRSPDKDEEVAALVVRIEALEKQLAEMSKAGKAGKVAE